MPPVTRYAKSGNVFIAYQIFGEGQEVVIIVPGFISNVQNIWDEPNHVRFLESLGRYARVVLFDKRGTGLSDRAPDLADLDQRMDDVRAVMDAAGISQATILGVSEGGPLAMLFSATHPTRCNKLILYGSYARAAHWVRSAHHLEATYAYYENEWGSGKGASVFAPSKAHDPAFVEWWGKYERLGASPTAVAELTRMNSKIDVSDIIPSIRVPTLILHRTDDLVVSIEAARELARAIPHASLKEFSGKDHVAVVGENSAELLETLVEFLTGAAPDADYDRVLATVLITDIVGSTEKLQEMGDRRWRDLLETHEHIVRSQLARFRGKEIKSLGDGFLSTFDGPARAIRCAAAIAKETASLGLLVRAGLHTGEIEPAGADIRGIAVHAASRVSAKAAPGEIWTTRTVRDLVAGSGISFSDRGIHHLKGLQDEMALFAATLS